MSLTGLGEIFDFGSKIIDKIFPDKDAADKAKVEMLKLQQQGEFKELELEYEAMKHQAAVNIEEAKNPNLFVSGWRPFVGWICGLGLGYSVLGQPILVSCKVAAPVTDTAILLNMLFALLGVAGMRTFERLKGVVRVK